MNVLSFFFRALWTSSRERPPASLHLNAGWPNFPQLKSLQLRAILPTTLLRIGFFFFDSAAVFRRHCRGASGRPSSSSSPARTPTLSGIPHDCLSSHGAAPGMQTGCFEKRGSTLSLFLIIVFSSRRLDRVHKEADLHLLPVLILEEMFPAIVLDNFIKLDDTSPSLGGQEPQSSNPFSASSSSFRPGCPGTGSSSGPG